MKFIFDSWIQTFLVLLLLLMLQVAPAYSATLDETVASVPPPAGPAAGAHEIGIRIGFLDQGIWGTGIFDRGFRSEWRYDGVAVGAFSYAYWVGKDLALELEAGGSEARVGHILFGARYYPSKLTITPAVRPYFSAAAGPFLGSREKIVIRPGFPFSDPARGFVATESVLDATAGARVGAGIDVFFQRRFKVGFFGGYQFTNGLGIEGIRRNTSGPEFFIGFGFLLGGRRSEAPADSKKIHNLQRDPQPRLTGSRSRLSEPDNLQSSSIYSERGVL